MKRITRPKRVTTARQNRKQRRMHLQPSYEPPLTSREKDACYVGALVSQNGTISHKLVSWALDALAKPDDRAGFAPDGTPDGCGIMTRIPHELFKGCRGEGELTPGKYGVGVVMLPTQPNDAHTARAIVGGILHSKGLQVIQWLVVPVNREALDGPVRDTFPGVECVVYEPIQVHTDEEAFDRQQYEALQVATHALRERGIRSHIASMSSRTMVLKGRIHLAKLREVYLWLNDPRYKSDFVIKHARMATGVAAADDRAHPKRLLAHNGEMTIDVLSNWTETQRGALTKGGIDDRIFPLIVEGMGDTAAYDDLIQYLLFAGWDLATAVRLTIQPDRGTVDGMRPEHRKVYRNARTVFPQVQGPATIVASNGRKLVITRDADGLRPANVWTVDVGNDTYLCVGSVKFDLPDESNLDFQRMGPGEMLVFDLETHRLSTSEDVIEELHQSNPPWNSPREVKAPVDELFTVDASDAAKARLVFEQLTAGWSLEDVGLLLIMAKKGGAPMTSMGNTVRHPAFSKGRRHSAYLKHNHAQMTRPPKDSKRESGGVDLWIPVGAAPVMHRDADRFHKFHHPWGQQLLLRSPILSGAELKALRADESVKVVELDAVVSNNGKDNLEARIDALCTLAVNTMARQGRSDPPVVFLVTDEKVDAGLMAIPTSMVVGAVDNALKLKNLRRECSIIASDASPAEAHVVAIHLATGGSAVHFRIAEETIRKDPGSLGVTDVAAALRNFYRAMDLTFIDTISKMGVSRAIAYFGSKLVYGNGLGSAIVNRCYPGITSPIGGIGFDEVATTQRGFHREAVHADAEAKRWTGSGSPYLDDVPRRPLWAKPLDRNLFGPDTPKHGTPAETTTFSRKIAHATYKVATATPGDESMAALAELADLVSNAKTDLSNMVQIKYPKQGVALKEVESALSIARKVLEGASMSWGALTGVAFHTIHTALNELGCRSAAGEGGQPHQNIGTPRFARIGQYAGGLWGLIPSYVYALDELQIKEAQGAKPGEGGELLGEKHTEDVSDVRHTDQPGTPLPSPAPIHSLYSIEDRSPWRRIFLQFKPDLRLSEKVVSAPDVAECLAGAVHLGFDTGFLSGEQGGTGASKAESQKHCGWHWMFGLALGNQRLCRAGYRHYIRLVVDGDIRIPRHAIIALLMGADGVGLGSSLMAAVGCVAEKWCQDGSCGVGVAGHAASLVAKFRGMVEHVKNFILTFAEGIRVKMAKLGFTRVEDMIGHTEYLEQVTDFSDWPEEGGYANTLDLSSLLQKPEARGPRYNSLPKNPFRPVGINPIDAAVLADERVKRVLETGTGRVVVDNLPRLTPQHIGVGAAIAGEIVKRYGKEGLKNGQIVLKLKGNPGPGLGCLAPKGLVIELEGLPPDFVGNHMDGGIIILRRPNELRKDRSLVIGNVSGFGSVAGSIHLDGDGDSRFAVRGSGLNLVAMRAGHNACSFMTRGRAVFLGGAGTNFCADMTGGKVWVREPRDLGTLIGRSFVGKVSVEWRRMTKDDDVTELRAHIEAFHAATNSTVAAEILATLEDRIEEFWVVTPVPAKPPQRDLGRQQLVMLRPTTLVEAN